MTAEDLFCIKHLRELGIDSSNFDENAKLLDVYDVPDFKMVKLEKSDFYEELAKQLRSMWPPGDKSNKYPWRDSVKNLKARLKLLWQYRQMKDYTLDECLAVATSMSEKCFTDTSKRHVKVPPFPVPDEFKELRWFSTPYDAAAFMGDLPKADTSKPLFCHSRYYIVKS